MENTIIESMGKIGLKSSDNTYNPGSTRVFTELFTKDVKNLILIMTWYEHVKDSDKYDLKENYWLWVLFKKKCDQNIDKLIELFQNDLKQ